MSELTSSAIDLCQDEDSDEEGYYVNKYMSQRQLVPLPQSPKMIPRRLDKQPSLASSLKTFEHGADKEPSLLSSLQMTEPRLDNEVLTEEPCRKEYKRYTMGGVPVSFPLVPYPSQMAIMSKIISGIKNSQNCLLESPTGSGKTLALLCGALAWQKEEKANLEREFLEQKQKQEGTVVINARKKKSCSNCSCQSAQSAQSAQPNVIALASELVAIEDDDDDDDFKPQKKKQKLTLPSEQPRVQAISNIQDTSCKCHLIEEVIEVPSNEPVRPRLPKIFYGTRTHKQIEQVIRELKKTEYSSVKMTILASREHMCINPLGKYRSKTEMCYDLTDPVHGIGCRYKTNVDSNLGCHEHLARYNCPEPFDIEDLVVVGKIAKACPYFASRSLMARGAELIFCPYNYLIDPQIQESMQINLSGHIVIFDEAHNIEDNAREAASFTVEQSDIKKAAEDCKNVAKTGREIEIYETLEDFLVKLGGWMEEQDDLLIKGGEDYDKTSHVWTGLEAIASFDLAHIGSAPFYIFKNALLGALSDMAQSNTVEKKIQLPCMTALTKNIIQGICQVLSNIYDNNMEYRPDYRVSIIKSMAWKSRELNTVDGWTDMSKKMDQKAVWQRQLNFWCQNPAVAMKQLRDATRSIILTSGTLAPTESFSSELDVKFPIMFEANHVINPSQVFVTSISHGPLNKNLNGQWKNAETFDFQDELGRLVLNVCKTVPHGVLCFLPSYRLLEKLSTRWKSTGLWTQLELEKSVLCEPRKASELDEIMNEFNRGIDDHNYHPRANFLSDHQLEGTSRTGSLMFAVHRGKISEGIDFADDQARAVIAVGIPYPNFKDVKVEIKRKYNDEHCKARKLLSGSRWYDIQAYRALNQALGRCIRHRNDWGAIILVDDRFSKGQYYTNGLSKWIRSIMSHNSNYGLFTSKLKDFVDYRLQTDQEADLQATM